MSDLECISLLFLVERTLKFFKNGEKNFWYVFYTPLTLVRFNKILSTWKVKKIESYEELIGKYEHKTFLKNLFFDD